MRCKIITGRKILGIFHIIQYCWTAVGAEVNQNLVL